MNKAELLGSAPPCHSRGDLPHFESADVIQHVTFHLADSLAKKALQQVSCYGPARTPSLFRPGVRPAIVWTRRQTAGSRTTGSP